MFFEKKQISRSDIFVNVSNTFMVSHHDVHRTDISSMHVYTWQAYRVCNDDVCVSVHGMIRTRHQGFCHFPKSFVPPTGGFLRCRERNATVTHCTSKEGWRGGEREKKKREHFFSISMDVFVGREPYTSSMIQFRIETFQYFIESVIRFVRSPSPFRYRAEYDWRSIVQFLRNSTKQNGRSLACQQVHDLFTSRL